MFLSQNLGEALRLNALRTNKCKILKSSNKRSASSKWVHSVLDDLFPLQKSLASAFPKPLKGPRFAFQFQFRSTQLERWNIAALAEKIWGCKKIVKSLFTKRTREKKYFDIYMAMHTTRNKNFVARSSHSGCCTSDTQFQPLKFLIFGSGVFKGLN